MEEMKKTECAGLPERFIQRMRSILGEEWEDFLAQWDEGRQYGLRVNTLKIRTEEFERIAPFHISRIPWIPNGYYYEKEDHPAGHPFYAAGLYYLQEPSAMTPASRLAVKPGERVLDLCAAPGGKATELAAGLSGSGLLVANEINPARARALLRNMELCGVTNSLITCEPPHVLAQQFPESFDKIMVDAPCSGEGMFRKNPAVTESWKEKGPEYFSKIQREIILCAADMLRPGGQMFYSTCTFAPEENEGVISHLLRNRPDMQVIPMEDYEGFAPGLRSFGEERFAEDCRHCRRIWPHRMAGEGHFLALLEKKEETGREQSSADSHKEPITSGSAKQDGNEIEHPTDLVRYKHAFIEEEKEREKRKANGTSLPKASKNAPWSKGSKNTGRPKGRKQAGHRHSELIPDREAMASLDAFLSHITPPGTGSESQSGSQYGAQSGAEGGLHSLKLSAPEIRGDKVYLVPSGVPEDVRLRFLRNGVYLGDLKKRRFEPSQPLALCLSPGAYDRTVRLTADDARLAAYLRGESIPVREEELFFGERMGKESPSKAGEWFLLLADGYSVGWGKLSGSVLKNKYPAGWRR